MKYGYVRISRKAYAEDDLWNERRTFSRWEAWEDLIQMAAWRAYDVSTDRGTEHLERGEVLASVRFLATRWRWSKDRVERFLTLLENRGRLQGRRRGHSGSVYLLVNYDAYQSATMEDETEAGTETRTLQGRCKDKENTSKAVQAGKRASRGRRREDAGSAPQTTTWLSGAATAWQAKFGAASAFPWGKAGKLLAPLKERPPEEITDHLARYLESTDARFVNLAKFAETYGAWGEDEKLTDEMGNPTAAYFRAFGGHAA